MFFYGMADSNYENILEKIARVSGNDKEEIKRKVEAKKAKLSGLISEEGAAQVVAAELGVNFDEESFKINELVPGMRKVSLTGKVINIYPVRTFKNKKGEDLKVLNFFIGDETSNIKVVLWDSNHIEKFENKELQEESVIDVENGSMRGNELHLGSFSEIKLSSESIENVVTEKIVKEKNISDFAISEGIKTRAFIVQGFSPKFFYVCPECKKKAVQDGEGFKCKEHGNVSPEKRALINFVLDDGTETIRAVAFSDNFEKLGLTDLEDQDKLFVQREDLLGREFVFVGNVRLNKYFNNDELIVEDVKGIDLDSLIGELENKK